MKNQMVDYTYKFRLYPTPEQEIELAKHFGCVRWVYNYFLESHIQFEFYTKLNGLDKTWLNYQDDAKELTEIKEELYWLNEVNAQSLQQSLRNLDTSFKRYYKKQSKQPKFKKKSDKQSFRIPQNIKVENDKFYIVKFREGINIKLHRPIDGTIRNATISKNKAGQYFVCIGVQRHIKKLPKSERCVGIDLGIKALATCSDGTEFENIKPYKTLEKKRRTLAKSHSRTIKGSKGRENARNKLAKLDNRICNIRQNHLHKISHKIVSENQTIVMEDLNVSGMLKNRKLSKSIQDCSLSELIRQINYKSKWYGREFIQVSQWFPSSKTCNDCGYIKDDLTLADREWQCPKCNCKHDRDINAAKNILEEGLSNRRNYGVSCLS